MSSIQALPAIGNDDQISLALPPSIIRYTARLPNWEPRLRARLKHWSNRSFTWGTADCVHFAFDCVEGMTGTNHIADIKPYACEREALVVLGSIHRGGLLPAVERYLGPAEDAGTSAFPFQQGDMVLTMRKVVGAPDRRGPGLGICMGDEALFVGAHGLEARPVHDCLCGWRI